MDPMQAVLLGGTGVTLVTGIVKSIKKRPKGEVVEQAALQEAVAMCAVCGAEADEFDEHRMRWVCDQHVSFLSRPPEVRQPRKPMQSQVQTQRPRVYVDPHDVETVRDARMLRQVAAPRRSRQDVYDDYDDDFEDGFDEYEEELCRHGRDPERCRACYEEEVTVQRRPVRQPQQQVRRQPQQQVRQASRRQPQPANDVDETLEYAVQVVQKYPNVTDAQLAKVLGMRRAESARPYRVEALNMLGLLPPARKSSSSRRR